MENLIVFAILMALGYSVGSYREKKHYEDIRRREKQTLHVPMMNFGAKQPLPQAQDSAMFVGSVVIASDYFKNFSASLRNLVGGRVTVYETLIDRGRREATLRMKEQAIAWGATEILNVRLENSSISGQNRGKGQVAIEIIAYGTAVR